MVQQIDAPQCGMNVQSHVIHSGAKQAAGEDEHSKIIQILFLGKCP